MSGKDARWLKIDEDFIALQQDIDLDNYLAPVNRAEELEKFIRHVRDNRRYNPRFEYESLPDVFETELRRYQKTLKDDDIVEGLYREAIDVRLKEIRMAQTHDAKDITRFTSEIYGTPSEDVLESAWKNLKTMSGDQAAYSGAVEGKVFDAEELAELCRDAMKRYGFHWKVIVKEEMGAKAAVDNLRKEFWIRADVKFHESLVKMMIVHEIGTHVLRSENGYAQPLKLFGRGLPAYQFTEEGLAEFAEERNDVLLPDTIYRISGRVVGVHLSLDASFWEVYQQLKPYFSIEMCFDIVQRAKLGIHDTSQPGAYTKDYTYLAGLYRVRAFFETCSMRDVTALFAGKVGFQHLARCRELLDSGFLRTPPVLPDWLPEIRR